MDVVTSFDLPQGLDQRSLAQRHGTLFDQKHVKATYTMDAYFVVLGEPTVHWHKKYCLLVQHVVTPSRRTVEGVCTG